MKHSILVLFLLSIASVVKAQKGTINGTITSSETGTSQPLPFVNVAIKGTTVGATTDHQQLHTGGCG